MSKPDMQRVALVTGASRGIGYAFAKALAAQGCHIIAVARTIGGLEELDDEIKSQGGSTTLVPLDLADFEAIDRLGAALHEKWGKLDLLVANAGVLGKLTPLGHTEAKIWQNVIDVNLTANWRLIRSVDPLLRAAAVPRAVFVSSNAARTNSAYWGAYSVSKAGLETLAKIYAAETVTTALKVNVISMGPIRSALRARAMPGEDPDTLTRPEEFVSACLPLFDPGLEETGQVLDFHAGRITQRL